MSFDPHQVRDQFPILASMVRGKPLVYLDSGATSQKPKRVIERLDYFYRERNANIHRGVHFLSQESTQMYEQARERLKTFLNAKHAKEVLFTSGCTEGINLVASSWGRKNLKAGDGIVSTVLEHHSNIVPWQMIAAETGARLHPIRIDDRGVLDLEQYETILKQGGIKMVAIQHVSNAIGTIHPVRDMIQLAHEYGALALIDGAQAAPHLAIDVQALDADFYVVSPHKMYGPTGVGVLYGKLELLEAMPPYQGGGDMIRRVSFDGTTYADLPAKFEAGTPAIAEAIGLGEAVEFLGSLGEGETLRERLLAAFEAIRDHEHTLLKAATEALETIPDVRIIGHAPDKSAIVSFVIEGVHPHDVGTILDSEGIAVRTGHHCCQPLMSFLGLPATTRASFGLYNTIEEAKTLAQGVLRVKEMFS